MSTTYIYLYFTPFRKVFVFKKVSMTHLWFLDYAPLFKSEKYFFKPIKKIFRLWNFKSFLVRSPFKWLFLTFGHRLNKKVRSNIFNKLKNKLSTFSGNIYKNVLHMHKSSCILSLHIHLLIPNDHGESLQTMQLDGKQL